MNYYVFAGRKEINFNNVKEYMFKIDENKKFAIFQINDDNYNKFITALGFDEFSKYIVESFLVLGDDQALYSLKPNGIEKINNKPGFTIESNWKRLCKLSKKLVVDANYRKKIINKANSNFVFKCKSLIGFDQYFFVDGKNDTVIPFRFKKAKKDNQPLVIYFAGGGTVGYDNYKPLHEFLFYAQGNKAIKNDCNILIPQTMFGECDEESGLNIYANYCNGIVKHMLNICNIDSNRVYAYGTSFGGKCVWRALLDDPKMYAGAVEAMGMLYNYKTVDLESISHIPIWLVHSSDDLVVKIDSDDYCYEQLKALGGDVNYTRWDKYGHKMSPKFYKKENWFEWLLSKTKPSFPNSTLS